MEGFGRKRIKSEKGLTLLEITVALALFGILALVSLNLIYYGARSSKAIEDKVEIINNMNYSLDIISRAVRESKSTEGITIGGSSEFKTLTLPGNISFQVQNGVIQKSADGTTQDITSRDKLEVTRLNFAFDPKNNGSIKIELTVRSRGGQTVKSVLEAAVRTDV